MLNFQLQTRGEEMQSDTRQVVQEARNSFAQGQFDAVISLTEGFLDESDAASGQALKLRARALARLGRADEAGSCWQRLAAISPNDCQPFLNLARFAKRERNWQGVLSNAEKVVSLEPNHVEALEMAITAMEKGYGLSASDHMWTQVGNLETMRVLAFALELDCQGRLAEAARAISSASVKPNADPRLLQEARRLFDDLVDRADALERSGDIDGAGQHYHAALRLDPSDDKIPSRLQRLTQPFIHAGRDSLKSQDWSSAAAAFERALRTDATNQAALTGLARASEGLERWSDAVQYLTAALKATPDDDRLWLRTGNALLRMGNFLEAAQAFGKVTSEDLLDRASAGREKVARDTFKVAKERFQLARAEQKPAVMLEAANALLAAFAVSAASPPETVERLVALSPRICRTLGREQRQAYSERDLEKAAEYGSALISLDKLDARSWLIHGRVLSMLRRHDDAVPVWEHVIALSPASADGLIGLARAHLSAGRLDQAATHAARALTMDPSNAQAQDVLHRAGH